MVGRPQSATTKADIEALINLKVPIATIARRLGLSRSSLYNKIKLFGLELPKFSNTSDETLTATMQSIKRDHPNSGEKVVHGEVFMFNVQKLGRHFARLTQKE